jgi:hypothetical protein
MSNVKDKELIPSKFGLGDSPVNLDNLKSAVVNGLHSKNANVKAACMYLADNSVCRNDKFPKQSFKLTPQEINIIKKDFGEITGVPFKGDLELEYLNEIKDSLKLFLSAKNLEEIFAKIQFEVIKLNYDPSIISDDISVILDENIERYNAYKIGK